MQAWKVQHSKENNFMALQFRYVHTISTFILSLRQIKWISHLQVFIFLLSPLCHKWTYSTHQELHTCVMLCCALLWFVVVHYRSILSKFFRVASLAVERSYNSPNPVWKWVNNSYVLKNYHITLTNKYNKQVQQNHLHIISDLLLFFYYMMWIDFVHHGHEYDLMINVNILLLIQHMFTRFLYLNLRICNTQNVSHMLQSIQAFHHTMLVISTHCYLGPLLLTWCNLNVSMNK